MRNSGKTILPQALQYSEPLNRKRNPMLQQLSEHQRQQFEHDGFLVIENFITQADCQRLISRAAELVNAHQPEEQRAEFSTTGQQGDAYFLGSGDAIRFFFEPCTNLTECTDKHLTINKIGHALHELDSVFREFSQQPAIGQLAADLGFDDPRLLQSMYLYKQARVGGEVGLHQDACFLYTEPLSVVGLWFALEPATLENGCLQVLPGGHRAGLKQRFCRDGRGSTRFATLDASPFPDTPLRPLPAAAGTAVLLHGLLPHYSAANRSAHSRQAYTLHLIEGSAKYPLDNWLQRRTPAPRPRLS